MVLRAFEGIKKPRFHRAGLRYQKTTTLCGNKWLNILVVQYKLLQSFYRYDTLKIQRVYKN
jgi:hypothetical protein